VLPHRGFADNEGSVAEPKRSPERFRSRYFGTVAGSGSKRLHVAADRLQRVHREFGRIFE